MCLCLVFFLEQCTFYRRHKYHKSFPSNIWKELLYDGVPSAALAVTFIPLLMKFFMCRCFPSMFKRMGFSVTCLLQKFLVYVLYNANSTGDFINSGSFSVYCNNNTQFSDHYISLTYTSILSLENLLHFIYRLLLYIAVWKFICCQSPQHMKGLLFGLLYAIQAFNKLLASFTIWTFDNILMESIDTCNRNFYFLNIGIAVLLLLIFTVVSYK